MQCFFLAFFVCYPITYHMVFVFSDTTLVYDGVENVKIMWHIIVENSVTQNDVIHKLKNFEMCNIRLFVEISFYLTQLHLR